MNMTNKVQEYSNDNSEIKSKYIAQDVESGERTETVKVTKEEVFDEIPTLVAFCMKLIGLYIDQKGKEIQTLILKTKGRETSNSTMEKVTEICDNLYERMRISNKYLGNFMGKFIFLVIVTVIAAICDILNLALSSQTNNNTALLVRYGGRVLYYSAMIFGVMWTLLQPSLAWTKVINRIKRPNVLQILTTQYFGNGDTSQGYKCFIDIMKFQRERVVWNCFGIPITENLFRQVIVSTTSAILLAVGLAIRGYMVQGAVRTVRLPALEIPVQSLSLEEGMINLEEALYLLWILPLWYLMFRDRFQNIIPDKIMECGM
eukprot:g6874.t1